MLLKTPRLRAALALSASTLAFGAFAPAAFAQDKAPAELEELVVTAEKREQSLQDVPVAISAFTSDHRDLVGIIGVQDLVNFTPGMNYSGTDRVSLRGAGRNTFYIGNDPGVAVYTDGFYSASTSELFKTPLFFERVEVLRGPQGTLYGRNALGGAVNVISKRPSHEFSGEVRGVVANYDRYQIEGTVSIPLAEHLRIKIGGGHDDQSKGFIKNIGSGGDSGTIKRDYFEVQAEAELGEKTTAWVRYSRTSWDDSTGIGNLLFNLVTPYETTTIFGPIAGLNANAAFGYNVPNPGVKDPYVQNANTPSTGQLRGNHLLIGQITYDLGFAELKWIGGFQSYEYQTTYELDLTNRTTPIILPGAAAAGGGLIPTFLDYKNDFKEHRKYYSNELNLTSKGDGPLEWILGLYQYHEDATQHGQLSSPQQAQLATPIFQNFTAAPSNPNRNFADLLSHLHSDAYAVFGQATYAFNDQWSLTGGLRYTKDEKSGDETQRLILFFPPLFGNFAVDVSSDLNPAVAGIQNFRTLSDSWDAVTGTLNLDWKPDATTLAYAKYSRGYKSGGFLLGTVSPVPEAKSEFVDAYEIGLKKTFAGQLQVNASLFYNDYKDLQLNLSQLNASGTSSSSNFINVDAEAKGLELEALWQPVHNLQLSLSYGYLDTKITKGCCFYNPSDPGALLPGAQPSGGVVVTNGARLVFQSLVGNELYQSPKNKVAANVNYTFDFDPGSLTLSASYFWTDSTVYQPFDDPSVRSPAYDVTDFRAIWKDVQNRYSIIGFVKNAFDQYGVSSTSSTNPTANFATPNPGIVVNGVPYLRQTGTSIVQGLIAPRTYGLELQYRF